MKLNIQLLLLFFTALLSNEGYAGADSSQNIITPSLSDSSQIYIQEIIQSKLPVVIDFWAEWCGPCRMLSPIIQQLKKEYKGKIKVLKINIDRNRQLSIHFNVRSIPAIFIIKDKIVNNSILGVQPKQAYINMIEDVLNPKIEKPDSTIQ